MPEFPELGWNNVPPPAHDQPNDDIAPNNQVNEQHEQVEENQSQESVILQVSDASVNNDEQIADVVIYQPPMAPVQPPLHIGRF